MMDLTFRGLSGTPPVTCENQRTYYMFCSQCTRMYTVHTVRKPSCHSCPRCRVAYKRYFTIDKIQEVHEAMEEPMKADRVVRWLSKIYNRTRLKTLQAWWAANGSMNKAPIREILYKCFTDLGDKRSEVKPRPKTVMAALMYDITLAAKIPESRRYKYTVQEPKDIMDMIIQTF